MAPSPETNASPPPTTTDERPPLFHVIETDAGRALRERPSLFIRTRMSLGFLLLFVLSLGITVASLVMLRRIHDKLQFLEAAASYTFEIQQARRYEKNYFLYGTNLGDAIEHVQTAEHLLARHRRNIATVVGATHADTMATHLVKYEELLGRLEALSQRQPKAALPSRPAIEAELRVHGSEMVSVAEDLMARERRSLNTMLVMSQRVPIVFLAVLLPLISYIVNFLTRQILRPLNRMMEVARRVAEGDFTPITPKRRYRDEFTELGLTMNHMMGQIIKRQELLVQAHKLQAVGTLTAGIAHELNNPINNIMLTASMLLEDRQTLTEDEQLDMATDLVDQAERTQRIVRNLLDFARESELHTGLPDVQDLVEGTLRLAANQLRLGGIRVERRFGENLLKVRGDHQQLNQVLLNLVLNAVDAMPQGGTLTVATGPADEPDFVAIELSDTGKGIPDHLLTRVFDPFFTTKLTGKGTGLGLSVSLGIVQKHGGDIRVTSKVDRGTTFTVLLPVARVPA